MATEGADESNLHTEKKYQKDAKIGEGTYAVVYQGRTYGIQQALSQPLSLIIAHPIP